MSRSVLDEPVTDMREAWAQILQARLGLAGMPGKTRAELAGMSTRELREAAVRLGKQERAAGHLFGEGAGVGEATLICGDSLKAMRRMADNTAQLVMTSPPYAGKMQRYGQRAWRLDAEQWAAWMLPIVQEMVRVCAGPVIVNATGFVKGRYHPACELLIADAYRAGIACERPCIWHKNAAPNRRDWFGNDWEFLMAFTNGRKERVWNWEAIATPPKFANGGKFRQRGANGERRIGGDYPTGTLARPRDVLRVTVGGGHLGSKLAHQNEAPFPEKLVEPFILALTNRGDTVLDPFGGSGTTAAVAVRHGRRAISIDLRASQVKLQRRRIAEATAQPVGGAV